MNDSLEWNIKLCSRLGQHICTFCELRSSLKSPKLKIDPFWLFYERLGRGLQRRRHWQKQSLQLLNNWNIDISISIRAASRRLRWPSTSSSKQV
ncbi:Beta-glucuronidase [Trichinella pseudospiralis]